MFAVAGLERYPHPGGSSAQLLQTDAARRELMAVGGINGAIPELRTETEPAGEIEDDLGIGTGFAARRHDRRPQLNQ